MPPREFAARLSQIFVSSAHHLAWKYLVGYFNDVLGIA